MLREKQGKRKLSSSKISLLAARLAQLHVGPHPLFSTARLSFALLKLPGRSIIVMLVQKHFGVWWPRSTVMSPLFPNLGLKKEHMD